MNFKLSLFSLRRFLSAFCKPLSLTFFIPAICALVIALLPLFHPAYAADETSDEAAPAIIAQPRAFTFERMRLARDLARRVSWTDVTIESLTDDRDGPVERAWIETLTAALLGEEERALAAAEAFGVALDELEENLSLEPGTLFALLETFDCLLALPEWILIPQETRTRLIRRTHAITQPREEEFEALTPLDLAGRWYRGLLFDNEADIAMAKQGTGDTPALERLLAESLNAEGITHNAGLARHVETAARLHTLLAALRNRDSAAFDSLATYARPMAAALCELLHPTAEWPYALTHQASRFEHLAALLERSYTLFDDSKTLHTLHALYDRRPRPPEGLLFGPSAIPSQRMTFSSALLPQTGAALLRNGFRERPISVLFDTGLSRLGHAAGPLSIELRVGDRLWTPPPRQRGAFDLNTVLIDGQEPYSPAEGFDRSVNALLLSMKEFPGVGTYAHATATGQYSEAPAYTPSAGFTLGTYERTLFLMDDILLDLFRARGGETHHYQYHAPAPWRTQLAPEAAEVVPLEAFSARTEPWMRRHPGETRQTRVEGHANLTAESQGLSERLWFINPTESEFITLAESDGADFVVNRYAGERGEGNLFAVLHEFFEGEAPDVRVIPLTLDPQPNRRSFQAVALALERSDRVDLFFATTDPSVFYRTEYGGEPFEFQGRFGHARLVDGEFDSLRLVGGVHLRIGEYAVGLSTPMLSGLVQATDPARGELKLGFPYGLPKQPDYVRESALISTQNPSASFYQPLLIDLMDYKLDNEPQSARAVQPTLLRTHAPHVGVSIESGDGALIDSVAVLQRAEVMGYKIYRLVFSAPAEVSVAARDDHQRAQILVSSLVRRFRGERDGNAIVFPIDPDESQDGIIEFTTLR